MNIYNTPVNHNYGLIYTEGKAHWCGAYRILYSTICCVVYLMCSHTSKLILCHLCVCFKFKLNVMVRSAYMTASLDVLDIDIYVFKPGAHERQGRSAKLPRI